MALKLKYTDEHGILHINMSPSSTPQTEPAELSDPKFDSINTRFGQYDLFGGKYEVEGEPPSLFRSRYNSIEEELANTPYAFTAERSLRLDNLDITIKKSLETSPSKDIEDDRFFRNLSVECDDSLFGPQIAEQPAFTVTQLIHAQDRYFDLSSRQSSRAVDSPRSGKVVFEVRSAPGSAKRDEAFKVLGDAVKAAPALPVVPTAKRKKETSFAILAEAPGASRPTSPHSLPVESRTGRVSPFKGRGFREETSRHNTPRTSAANSRASSPRRRTSSLSKIDKMATVTATLPPPLILSRPQSPRNFLKQNIEEVRELSELNREKHEAEAEQQRIEEEAAILKEMGILDKNASAEVIRSVVASRNTSRCNSPSKINLKSRSSSPVAILHYENIPADSKEFVNANDGIAKPVTHTSRVRAVSRSQPQSNNASPQHSKIPKRQSSVSPKRTVTLRDFSNSRKSVETNLSKSQRFMSNSTSSIHETIRIGGQAHDKRNISKSTQHLSIAPVVIKGKPPISPGRGGPPPSNKSINAKRLSPIVGTPNKSPTEDLKPSSAKTPKPSPLAKKPIKTAGNTPATSRLNSRQPSRTVSRDPSPDKRRPLTKVSTSSRPPSKPAQAKPVNRSSSTRLTQKPNVPKTDVKKPINRTNSMKSLVRTPSTKTLNERPPLVKRESKKDIKSKAQSTPKLNEVGIKKESMKEEKKIEKVKSAAKDKVKDKAQETKVEPVENVVTEKDDVKCQDNETQYDKIVNENGEIVLLTKKSVISMTTAAITAQPLDVVTKVTNQLPAAFEKAREKGIFERHSSKDSLAPKDEEREKDKEKEKEKEIVEEKDSTDDKPEEKKASKQVKNEKGSNFIDDNVKLKPLLPPYSNPQVELVRQKIDNILKSPEVSTENILAASEIKDTKIKVKNIADKAKDEIKEVKAEVAAKTSNIKDEIAKESDKAVTEIRSEATKIVDSIITPVQEPKAPEKVEEAKKTIEPIVMVVNEKKGPSTSEVVESMSETLVKGEPEVEVQSSNLSSPRINKMAAQGTAADGNDSDKSAQSNGGFPQSTSTTPRPPARANRPSQNEDQPKEASTAKKPGLGSRLMGKCRQCCPCCGKHKDEEVKVKDVEKAEGLMSKLNCCKRKTEEEQRIRDVERAAGKAAIDFENETKRKRKLRDVLCCGRGRVGDVSAAGVPYSVGEEAGCCGRRRTVERRDSILSDREPATCCNNRLCTWLRGMCRRRSEPSTSRRASLFSKNKSMSPTLPPEDTRKKLDPSLVEHTSVIRAAIPALPIVLAYWCLFCNVLVPGLGTIFSGVFCLCFGIPRFGVHDGAKHRIGSFVINLLVGCGQLFTVLFCLVGWGWSIWWGVIMVRVSRKYRKLKAEAAAEEAEAPPVTTNNHTARA